MDELNGWGYQHATDGHRKSVAHEIVASALAITQSRLVAAVETFLTAPISPGTLFRFELELLGVVRELGRLVLEVSLQSLEPSDPVAMPKDIYFLCCGYRRRSEPTRNASILSRFGKLTLWRTGYRSWQRGEETIFPLELMLGLVENVTPAMLDWIGKSSASLPQRAVLDAIREESGSSIGVKRLRGCIQTLAERLEPLRQTHQVDALTAMLEQARNSNGPRKPVLCVGRDGITLRHQKGFFEVATAATISVYDRVGKRLGTIYLAHPPELGQETMDSMLTSLLNELFTRLKGPLPRLSYVTDSGSNEVDYFKRHLRKMKHPVTGQSLEWMRVADFYHVSERIWAMADELFTTEEVRESKAWVKRMLKNLTRPNGASRVLHSAASLKAKRQLTGKSLSEFEKAYQYLKDRTAYLKYHEYRNLHIPIGSGITEAACRTIFTQRLKLSGMRWSHDGAKCILTLRTILLSRTWDSTYADTLNQNLPNIRAYNRNANQLPQNAA